MKSLAAPSLLAALLTTPALSKPVVDEKYPYKGPAVPVGDWVDPTVNGNGKGFPRLVEPPAVKPGSSNPSNNVNLRSHSSLFGCQGCYAVQSVLPRCSDQRPQAWQDLLLSDPRCQRHHQI
ncbi:hypothetical protein LB505_007437 [Fusarium chuoi]|nr:hypothetical protein LB505_007437 [Fusarium chuoi]